MYINYKPKDFRDSSLQLIHQANKIIKEYQSQGYDLTLRQLYYQMVANAIIANKQTEYKRLGSIINDARLAGLVSWTAIVDRTRNIKANSHWDEPKGILDTAAIAYLEDRWHDQEHRLEVWIEKDALIGVISGLCSKWDVPAFSCRGYVSQSEMWQAGYRRMKYNNQHVTVIHLGDHDPSGIDMTRDIQDRLELLSNYSDIEVDRIALNMDQIEELQPPPNPTKLTDSRAKEYIYEYGQSSWELDALKPDYMHNIITEKIREHIDFDKWHVTDKRILLHRRTLAALAENFADIQGYMIEEEYMDDEEIEDREDYWDK